jgi:sugar phosphate isomerase/epimerase
MQASASDKTARGGNGGTHDMHDRISVNSVCFMGEPLRDQADHWRQIGARRVSLIGRQIMAEGVPAAQAALATGDYELETIAYGFLLGRHLEPREDLLSEARDGLSRMIKIAETLQPKTIYMTTGGHGSMSWEDAAECFSTAIAPCVAQANDAGIPLIIENSVQFYAHTNLVHTLRDTVLLAEMAGIGVCIEIYASWMEAGLRETIARAMPRCHLVQVSDYVYGDNALPGRAVPGDGGIPIKRLCDWILRAGYKGQFDLELLGDRIEQEGRVAAADRAAKSLGAILESLGA